MELILTCSPCICTGTSLRAPLFQISLEAAADYLHFENWLSASKSDRDQIWQGEFTNVNTLSEELSSTQKIAPLILKTEMYKITRIKPSDLLNTAVIALRARQFDVFLFNSGKRPKFSFDNRILGSVAKPTTVLQRKRRLDAANWEMPVCGRLHALKGLFFVRT